jgi:hypothetical protein
MLAGATVILAVALMVAGCSSATPSRPSSLPHATPLGSLTLQVRWPESSVNTAMVPDLSQSIAFQVLQDTTVVGETLIARPATTATIHDIPSGHAMLYAWAYPNSDGSGVSQAAAEKSIVVQPYSTGQPPEVVTLASTVAEVEVIAAPQAVAVTETTQVTATALDDQGRTVLVPPFTWSFSGGTGLAVIASTTGPGSALVRGLAAGTATVRATTRQHAGSPASDVHGDAPVVVFTKQPGTWIIDWNGIVKTLTFAFGVAGYEASSDWFGMGFANYPPGYPWVDTGIQEPASSIHAGVPVEIGLLIALGDGLEQDAISGPPGTQGEPVTYVTFSRFTTILYQTVAGRFTGSLGPGALDSRDRRLWRANIIWASFDNVMVIPPTTMPSSVLPANALPFARRPRR